MILKDGVHDIPNDVYHSSAGLSRSALMEFKKSPAHYYYKYLSPHREPEPPTKDMMLGNLVHTLSLEPELLHDEFVMKPVLEEMPPAVLKKDVGAELFEQIKSERARIKSENDALIKEFKEESKNKIIVDDEMMTQALSMTNALNENKYFKSLKLDAKIEQSIYFTHKPTGLQCKARPDIWSGSIVTDLKTTSDASFKAFQSSAAKFGYFLQAGMIKCALESIGQPLDKFVFSAVEKKEPFAVATYLLDDDAIEYGEQLFHSLMEQFAECKASDRWPSYQLRTLTMPNWLRYED